MRSSSRPLAALLAPLTALTLAVVPPEDAPCRLIRGADTTDDPTDDVEVCEVEAYLHRALSPVGNVAATAADELPSWDENEPTSPAPAAYVQALGSFGGSGANKWPTFEGTFTGNLDTMVVEMYLTNEVYQQLLSNYPLIFDLTVDDVRLTSYRPAAGEEKDVALYPVDDGISVMRFGLHNIHEAMEAAGLDVDPGTEHTVRLAMSALYFGDGNSVYWFDSPERPSNIHFNADLSTGFLTRYDIANGGA